MPVTKYTFKERTYICSVCSETIKRLDWDYDAAPTHCNVEMEPKYDYANISTSVIGDDIPGGYVVRHGACYPDGTPRKFYTKTAIREAARANGFCYDGDTPKAPRETR